MRMDKQTDFTNMTQILQLSPVGVIVLDAEGRITWVNRTFEKILGKSIADLQGIKIADIAEMNLTEMTNGVEAYQVLSGHDREERWYSRQTHALLSEASKKQTVEYLIDVTYVKSLYVERDLLTAQLQEIAPIDPNSGLLTEKAIMQNVDLLVSRSRRYENPLSVIVMAVNGTSPEFDSQQVMSSIGQLLKDQMRWADLICRVGDNQFLMVLPETDTSATEKLVSKISSHLNQLSVPYGEGAATSVDADFGLSSWQKGDDRSILIERAQDALKEVA